MYPQPRQQEYLPPAVEILTQPHSYGTRFRYEFEERRGGLLAVKNSGSNDKRNVTIIRVANYCGPLSITVSCVEKNLPHRPHPHKIACGDIVHNHGAYTLQIPQNPSQIPLRNLNIRCIARKYIKESLLEREQAGVDPFKTGFSHKCDLKNIDLNCVRFCFEVTLITPAGRIPLQPVVSHEIRNKKSDPSLQISYLSHNEAPASGGTTMCVLCEKIPIKTEVEVRFYDRDEEWEANGTIKRPGIFRQVAIVLETPAYTKKSSYMAGMDSVDVFVQLRRVSDGSVSDPFPFRFVLPISDNCAPSEYDDSTLKRKRSSTNKYEVCGALNSQLKSRFPVDPRIFDQTGNSSENDINRIMSGYFPVSREQPSSSSIRNPPSILRNVRFTNKMSSARLNPADMEQKPNRPPVARTLANAYREPDKRENYALLQEARGMNDTVRNPGLVIDDLQEPRQQPTRPPSYAQPKDPLVSTNNYDGRTLDSIDRNISSEIRTSDLIQDLLGDSSLMNNMNTIVNELYMNGNYGETIASSFQTTDMMNIPAKPMLSDAYQVSSGDGIAKLIDI